MGCPYANMSKSELKKVVKEHKKRQQYVHQFKCAFCGLVHDKIELGSFSMGYPTLLKIEDDFAIKLTGNKDSIIKGKMYKE